MLLQAGHELGNHLGKDISGYYCNLDRETFQGELHRSTQILNEIMEQSGCATSDSASTSSSGRRCRWFRPPQGLMTKVMRNVVQEEGLQTVLGDCYCDDWAFAEEDDTRRERVSTTNDEPDWQDSNCRRHVAPLMVTASIAEFAFLRNGFW